jgi:hypothetical protein
MSERPFDKALERGFAVMRARRGPCPTAEKLGGLATGELAADEAAAVRGHVALCGACDAILVRLRRFEEAAHTDLGEPIRRTIFPRPRAGRLAAVAGYAIAAGVAIGAYFGVIPQRGAERPGPAWDVVETLDLNRARGGQAPSTMEATTRLVVLAFFVDIRPDLGYEVALDGGAAQRITSYDNAGNFHLVVDRRLLGAGRHVLKVMEGGARTIEFPFQVN